ncbi:MAG: aminoglycoside phosphotransferase family protein, partial [Chloroflexota bacterium]|nr:aminoglycoside phosphotransferase family protein [Chloroflexota bacterium]
WSLVIEPPFPNLSYNYASPATRADGTAVVLKACFPDQAFVRESEALLLFAGRGAVRLLEADPTAGVMLLERLVPGAPLRATEDDAQATSIAATVMRRLWRPVPSDHPFPTIADWAAGIGRYQARFADAPGPIPATLANEAARLFAELLASQADPVLLHGDLHHDNILQADREPWLAIDPKGVVGEPAYDTGALLRNPAELFTMPQPARILARRIAQLADELDLDRARIRGWAVAQAVLASLWSFEDHGRISPHWIAIAEWLSGTKV